MVCHEFVRFFAQDAWYDSSETAKPVCEKQQNPIVNANVPSHISDWFVTVLCGLAIALECQNFTHGMDGLKLVLRK